jgi:PemK-like, MazF-like toxin of type II toxin-antitoxin system
MILNQRDVIEVYFKFPDGQVKPHPIIVLSVAKVFNHEKSFIGVPISHSEEYNSDYFSFPISNQCFEKHLKHQDSYVRMHLITLFSENDVVEKRKVNEMKTDAFNEMYDQIQQIIFGCQ